MNVVFLGGGSLRLTPIFRGLLKRKEIFDNGSIRLVDLNLERAEMVGQAIKRCPEMQGVNCNVTWTKDLDAALDGADVLYLTMAVQRQPSLYLSQEASAKHGFMSSDQLSIPGAFLAARAGGAILSFARKMEKYCPQAMMLIFVNPVATYSAMVNNHTKIKALGICGGFRNHCWDIPRLCGRDEYDESMEVVSAGVNHLSFLLRGRWQGRDLFEVMREHLTEDWKPVEITSNHQPELARTSLKQMVDLFHRYNTTIFSSEGDGIGHLFPEHYLSAQKNSLKQLTAAELDKLTAQSALDIEQKFTQFAKTLQTNDDSIWDKPLLDNPLFGMDDTDLSISIMAALAGLGSFRIAASAANNGAVKGFPDRAALEYTMTIDGNKLTPIEDQYVPSPFQGIIAGMSEFQTLQGDAIATGDPKLFAQALEAYPVQQFSRNRREYFHRLFEIFTDIPKSLQKAKELVRG